jgi:hypothetical protein
MDFTGFVLILIQTVLFGLPLLSGSKCCYADERSTNKCLALQPVRAANREMLEDFNACTIQIATWECALGRDESGNGVDFGS